MKCILMVLSLLCVSFPIYSSAGVLADNQLGPLFTATDGKNVYWTNYTGGQVMKAPADGTGQPVQLAEAVGPRRLRVEGGKLYWAETNSGKIMAMSTAGGKAEILAENQDLPVGLIIADGFAYWTNMAAANFDGTVMRVALTGGVPEVLADKQAMPMGLEVVDGVVYWSTVQARTVPKILKLAIADRKIVEIATAYSGSLASDQKQLYWLDGMNGKVMAMQFTDGKIFEIAAGQSEPGGLTSDGENVFWTIQENRYGSIVRANVAGGQPVVLSRYIGNPFGLSCDGKNVYWADAQARQILFAPKN